MSWKIFEKDTPELARLAFERLNRKIAYLATLMKDGSPHLHPVTPFIGNGMLFIFSACKAAGQAPLPLLAHPMAIPGN
jgi:hypothetical protein